MLAYAEIADYEDDRTSTDEDIDDSESLYLFVSFSHVGMCRKTIHFYRQDASRVYRHLDYSRVTLSSFCPHEATGQQ